MAKIHDEGSIMLAEVSNKMFGSWCMLRGSSPTVKGVTEPGAVATGSNTQALHDTIQEVISPAGVQ